MDLNTIWFVLVGVLLAGYMVLDGFDLGTGPLLLCAENDTERRILLNAIGPVWNGNEVWLVTAAGALFAAFPDVFATIAAGFYDLFMIWLAALVFRAVAIELRSRRPGKLWRGGWDLAFAISSLASAFLLGVTIGNIAWGVPLDASRSFHGGLLTALHPYPIVVGLTTILLFTMHANVYLVLKTTGRLQQKLMAWTKLTVPAYLLCFVVTNSFTLLACPHVAAAVSVHPWRSAVLLGLSLLIAFQIPHALRRGWPGWAFLASSATIVLHLALAGATAYPVLLFSTPNHEFDMTIWNSAATPATLRFMLAVAVIGLPLVLSYTVTVYTIFRRKVVLDEESY